MIGSLRRLTAYPMTWSSVLALSILLSSAAAAQNVNSNLCGTNSKNGTERILSPAQTKELVRYVDGLRQGSHVFNWTISGHYAADQLGFGKRFAATYGQAVGEVKLRMNRKRSVHIDEIIEYLGGALSEEQFIDGLIAEGERHFPAIVYLRALQEGDCAFPYVLRDTPSAQAMLNQLAQAYPEVKKKKGFASEPFLDIYDRAVAYGRDRIKQDGSVSIYRLIEEWRRAIVQSAKGTTSSNVAAAPSVSPPKPPVEKSSGSGFFVTQAGHLLTNAHVVGDCTTIHVKSSDGQTGVAKVIAADQNNDLALLRLERRIEMIAAFRTGRPTRPGESAVVFGFPLSQLLSSTGNATIGIVSALAGLRDDPNQIQISAPVQSGSSGGPVLDASGQLIGVVVSKLNAVRGDVPQNVNFAIKASTAAKFLDARGIAYRSATSEKALAIPDIVEQARGFSAQVLCQG